MPITPKEAAEALKFAADAGYRHWIVRIDAELRLGQRNIRVSYVDPTVILRLVNAYKQAGWRVAYNTALNALVFDEQQ